MNTAEKCTFVLEIPCGLVNGYLLMYGRIVKEEEGVMYAYLPAVTPFGEPTDNTTTFEAAHPDLLGKIQKIMHDLGEAPLTQDEIDRLDQAIQNAAWPTVLETVNVNELWLECEASNGAIKEYIVRQMQADLGPACPQHLLTWKSKMDGVGLKARLDAELDP
jgi:hypothetical protein